MFKDVKAFFLSFSLYISNIIFSLVYTLSKVRRGMTSANFRKCMRWTVHLEGGPQRVNHASVAIDHNIYCFGGYSSSEGYKITGKIDIYVLNTDTLRWSSLPYSCSGNTVPFQRYGHTVVVHCKKIYLWGGRNDFKSSNLVHCFDVDSLTWSLPPTHGPPPLAADGNSACVIDDHMYIFGGFQDDTEKFGQTVHRLNLFTFEWEAIETLGRPPPAGRDFHTASAIGSRMYIFGGRSTTSQGPMHNELTGSEYYCNKIMYLNTTLMKWVMPETLGRIPSGRRSHSAVVYNDQLYIIGGYNGISQNHLNDIHKFNPVTNHWSQLDPSGKGPGPRRRHCSVLIDTQLFIFGGSSPRTEGEKVCSTGQDFQKLFDHSDLHILDFFPSLKRLCQLKTIEFQLNITRLPRLLALEIDQMTTNNTITTNDCFSIKDYEVLPFSD